MIPLLMAGVLVVYNNAVNRWAPFHGWAYVPLNLGLTAALLAVALGPLGLSRGDLGLVDLGRGAATGVAGGLLLAMPVLLLSASRQGAEKLADARFRDAGPGEIAYRSLVRIPLGTALPEEVAFRGVLFAVWEAYGAIPAAVATSLAFGAWHIVPGLNRLMANHPGATAAQRRRAAAGTVTLTAGAGLFLVALRLATGTLAAPLLLHSVLNASCTAGAFAAHRRLARRGRPSAGRPGRGRSRREAI